MDRELREWVIKHLKENSDHRIILLEVLKNDRKQAQEMIYRNLSLYWSRGYCLDTGNKVEVFLCRDPQEMMVAIEKEFADELASIA